MARSMAAHRSQAWWLGQNHPALGQTYPCRIQHERRGFYAFPGFFLPGKNILPAQVASGRRAEIPRIASPEPLARRLLRLEYAWPVGRC